MGDRIAVFNQGVVEQVGAPMSLYQQPDNRFVAQFLGSPRMNLLGARIEPQGDGHVLQVPGLGALAVALPAGIAAARCAQIGVRPESIEVGDAGTEGWSAQIDFIERLGDTTLLYARVPGVAEPLCVKLAAAAVPWAAGAVVALRPARGALHLFDATGACIGAI